MQCSGPQLRNGTTHAGAVTVNSTSKHCGLPSAEYQTSTQTTGRPTIEQITTHFTLPHNI
jgi:hypothetical protein